MSRVGALRRSGLVGATLRSVPATLVPGLSSGLGAITIGRLAGGAELGLVSLAVVTASFGASTVGQTTASLALREVAVSGTAGADHYRLATLRRGVGLGCAFAVAAVVVAFARRDLGMVILVGAVAVPLQAVVLFETEVLRAAGRFGAASAWLSLRAVAAWILATAATVQIGPGGGAAAFALVTGVVAAALAARRPWPRADAAHREALRTIGRPITRQALASYALGYGDRYVIEAVAGSSAVGVYAIGYVLGQGVVEVVTTPIVAALNPTIVREVRGGASGLGREARRGAGLLVSAGALAVLGLVLLHGLDLVRLVAPKGSDPQEVAVIAVVVATATVLQGVIRILHAVLLGHGATAAGARSFTIALVAAAVVVPVLTATAGIVGAAAATLAVTALLVVLMYRAATIPADSVQDGAQP